jgi:hypothetical protein
MEAAMATTSATRTDTSEAAQSGTTTDRTPLAAVGDVVSSAATAATAAAGAAATAAGDATMRLPELVDRGMTTFDDVNRRIHVGSDTSLATGTAVSFGFAVGLLIGGANRILVAVAMIPVAMLGLTLLDRTAAGQLAGAKARAGTTAGTAS